jgi:HEAT repeat protein
VLDENHGNQEARIAKATLIKMGDRAIPTLLKCISCRKIAGEFTVATQVEASVILARIGGDQAIDGLINLLDACLRDDLGLKPWSATGREADVRRKVNIARAFAGIEGAARAAEPLHLLRHDICIDVSALAIIALARAGDPKAIEVLSWVGKETATYLLDPKEDFRYAMELKHLGQFTGIIDPDFWNEE